MKKIVLTYGTFDLFHVGHVRLLKRLKELGDILYVGISTDKFNEVKGKSSFFSYEERKEILLSCKYVDFVFPEECWEQKVKDIEKYNITTFAIGDDWMGEFDELCDYCDVKYLDRTPDISTTKIKKMLTSFNDEKISTIESELNNLLSIVKAIK